MATQEVVSGNPAKKVPILKGINPPPTYKLFPATMSCTYFLSNPTFSVTAFNTGTNMALGGVSFNNPKN